MVCGATNRISTK
jgi:hypothetical protein